MQDITAAAIQFEHAEGDKKANLAKVRHWVELAARRDVELAVFPECCITGYWYLRHSDKGGIESLAEPAANGPTADALLEMSSENRMTIGAGFIEAGDDGNYYNSYLVAMPNGVLQCHRKLHTFVSRHLASGKKYTVFDTPHGCRVGVLICYDCNIIENVRMNALLGADILIAPHQTGGCRTRNPHLMGVIDRKQWDERASDPEAIEREFHGDKGRGWLLRWLPSRAHDNGMFLIFANGVGVDDDEIRTGNSMILDPYGRILQETWKADDEMVVAKLDSSLLADSTGRMWMRARRPELYDKLAVPTGHEASIYEVKASE